MLKNINIKWFGLGVALLLMLFAAQRVYSESVTTSVVVGNDSPAFSVDVAENPASDGTSPTNAGSSVTFQATATDSGSEDYYLAICQTNAVTATNGGAPTCDGGEWAISNATSSGAQASVSYTTLTGDAESNVWYAFVCDGNASAAACSTSSQGSGSSGSPFKVNHAPAFTSANLDQANYDPGDSPLFTATASDADTDTSADTVTLVVCRTAGVSGTACDGGGSDTWCTSTAAASNPSCSGSLNAVEPHGSQNAFVYVFDNHGLASGGAAQGTNVPVVVNDVAPVVSAVTLNGGSDIILTEGSTTAVSITATVTDNNSCQDLTGVTTTVYRSGVTYANCDTGGEADDNSCYAIISCSVSGGSCTGGSDAAANYTCTVNMEYHADPTDAATEYPTENWLTTVIGTDGSTSTPAEIGTGVEVASLIGLTVTPTINYGSLNVGQSNDPLDRTMTITNTGNVGLDAEFSGTDMTDGGSGTITVDNQEYALVAATAYGAGTDLTTSAVEEEINLIKTTSSGSPATNDTYWGLLVPGGTAAGTYAGTNTVSGVKGEVVNW